MIGREASPQAGTSLGNGDVAFLASFGGHIVIDQL